MSASACSAGRQSFTLRRLKPGEYRGTLTLVDDFDKRAKPKNGFVIRGALTWAVLRALRHRDFRLLWIGQAVSLIGDGIYLVAIAWLVYDISNDARRARAGGPGLDAAAGGRAAASPGCGAIASSGACCSCWRTCSASWPSARSRRSRSPESIELWHVVVLVVFYGVGEALFQPAFTAIVPDVVPRDELLQANALRELMEPVGMRFARPRPRAAPDRALRRRRGAPGGRGDVRGVGDRGLADVAPAGDAGPSTARCEPTWPRASRTCARTPGCGRRWPGCALPAGDLRPVRGAPALHHPQRPRRRRRHVRRRARGRRPRLDRRGADREPEGPRAGT